MEEEQFERLLDHFPVVRTRSYCHADDVRGVTSRPQRLNQIEEPLPLGPPSLQLQQVDGTGSPSSETEVEKGTSDQPTSLASLGEGASFWDRLRAAAEQQLDHHEVQQFCDAFKSLHEELVNKALSLDAIERIAKHWPLRAK